MRQRFTLAFGGDIRQFQGNPMLADTAFGRPRAASTDDEMLRLNLIEHAIGKTNDGDANFRSRVIDVLGMTNDQLYASAMMNGLLE